jgi:glucose-6-phosphate 1-epimerase
MISDSDRLTPCTPLRTHAADGALLVGCAHGGHLLGWIPAGDDRDRLWLSPLARCGPGEAIRGGVPVIFPQFAGRGPLPKHGLARDRAWELVTGSDGAPLARIAARLTDDEQTRAIWPHAFTLTLIAEAAGPVLTMILEVRNDAPPGGAPFSLTAALHSYLSADAAAARIDGLGGLVAADNAASGATVLLPAGPLPALGPRDLAVTDTTGPVTLTNSDFSAVRVQCPLPESALPHDGFDSMVVWNPGDDHGLADVPPDGARHFVCVEPARLTPVTIEPQGVWRAVARLEALVPSR